MPAFLDANVFLYAAGSESPQKEPCVALLARVARGEFEATTSVEVIQELHHVFRRGGRLADGVTAGRAVLTLFPEVLPITRADLIRSGDILLATPRLSPRDALHAATALNNGIAVIVSVDADFDLVAGLTRVDPTAA